MTLPIGGGIGVATLTDGSALSPQNFFADVLSSSMQDAWTTFRPQIETAARNQLGTADLIRPGFTLYDIDVRISHDLSYEIDRNDQGDVVITVSTGGNYIETTSTQPTAAGEWADPRFSIAFCLSFSYVLDIPPITAPIAATGVSHARILSPVVDSHGVIADLAFILNDVYAWFGGDDYVAKIEGILAGMDFASVINTALGPVNETLTALAGQGFWFLEAAVDRLDGQSGTIHALAIPGAPADQLELLLTARAFDLSGAIEGELSWPVERGMPRQPGRSSDRISAISLAASSVLVRELPGTWGTSVAEAESPGVAPAFDPAEARFSGPTTVLTRAISAFSIEDRVTAVSELRGGVASRFVSLVGAETVTAALREFMQGRTDFVVQASTGVGGDGLFADMKPVGRMAALWAADDAQHYRRHYRLVDVATDVPLLVTAAVAPGLDWVGPATDMVVVPDGWNGAVTVHRAPHSTRRFDNLTETSIDRGGVFAERHFGGAAKSRLSSMLGEEAQLNPQPLPPVDSPVQLNPQPLPPVEVGALRTDRITAVSGLVSARSHGVSVSDTIEATSSSAVIGALLMRDNPTGTGVVKDIDFTVHEFVAPVVR